ncbi:MULTISPECIES: hypothetical protein [Pedobacter]|uniref:Plasmid transfer protein n=2 Tax=Pedobacter TaxID=84567 RepID=A0A369PQM0_9SPHI|nr:MULTISPECIES: hypothetical protein [Pedobacter]KQR68244.1 hypothetical protein ASF92_15350 [Pedobacter sp. Leaf176]MCZ4224684.1 hypothetical protein [Pedobacter sp. SJ11]RDC54582.1 hypothetical protein DU508_20385 [Pedobacter chinensis]RZM28844.1 MAG: hypothetical protein EOO88_07330 [Pedobacter sp.]
MRKIFIYFLFGIFVQSASAQIYVDPTTAAATAAHAGVMNSGLSRTSDNLTLVQRAQLAVTGQLGIVNDLQSTIYRGLSEVSGVMRSLLSVKDIYAISQDIVIDVNKAINLASGDPVLLLFAEGGAREFKTRSINLATEVSSFVLKDGRDALMDSGERAKLLNRIVTELTILRGVAYGMYRTMYWAKQRGILNSLNPYAGYINIDKRIADDIIRNAKMLKQ